MKIKTVVSVTAAILYGMGTATAAMENPNALRGLDLPQEALEKLQERGSNIKNLSAAEQMLQGSQVNRQLFNGKPRQKFVLEAGLQGEHTYIVRLKDAPVATYDGRLSGYGANENVC